MFAAQQLVLTPAARAASAPFSSVRKPVAASASATGTSPGSNGSSATKHSRHPSSRGGAAPNNRGTLRGIFWGGATASVDAGNKSDVACSASVAQGPHAVTVPLPSSGPLAPPPDIQAAVQQWPWRGGLEPCGERPVAPLPPSSNEGTNPHELTGTFYRVGPGRLRIGKDRYAHWFDGDGFITAIELDGATNSARAGARTVRTDRIVKQEKAGGDNIAVRGAWTQAKSIFANLVWWCRLTPGSKRLVSAFKSNL